MFTYILYTNQKSQFLVSCLQLTLFITQLSRVQLTKAFQNSKHMNIFNIKLFTFAVLAGVHQGLLSGLSQTM